MNYFQNEPPREDASPLGPVNRWFQAVTGHFCFVVCTGLLLGLSLIPAVLCVYGFLSTGALLFVLGWTLSGAAVGAAWTAVQRAAWELQFGHPCYLYRSLLHWLWGSLRQGALLGVLWTALWTLLLSPAIIALMGGAPMPVWLVVCLGAGALVLASAGNYAFYQAARWELRLREILSNSLLLLLAAGWRGLLVGGLWLLFLVGLAFWYPVVFPLCVVTGLPVLLGITAQAVFAPQVDQLMDAGGEAG